MIAAGSARPHPTAFIGISARNKPVACPSANWNFHKSLAREVGASKAKDGRAWGYDDPKRFTAPLCERRRKSLSAEHQPDIPWPAHTHPGGGAANCPSAISG